MAAKFGVELDIETADRIVVCALKEHYDYIKVEIEEVDILQPVGTEAESKTYVDNLRLATAMKIVLEYFGEHV